MCWVAARLRAYPYFYFSVSIKAKWMCFLVDVSFRRCHNWCFIQWVFKHCGQYEADTTSFQWPAVQVAMGTRWGLSGDYYSGDHTWFICIQFKLGKIQKRRGVVGRQKWLVILRLSHGVGGCPYSWLLRTSAGFWILQPFVCFVSVVRPIRNATSQGPFGIIPFNLI